MGATLDGKPLPGPWSNKDGPCTVPGSPFIHENINYYGTNVYVTNFFHSIGAAQARPFDISNPDVHLYGSHQYHVLTDNEAENSEAKGIGVAGLIASSNEERTRYFNGIKVSSDDDPSKLKIVIDGNNENAYQINKYSYRSVQPRENLNISPKVDDRFGDRKVVPKNVNHSPINVSMIQPPSILSFNVSLGKANNSYVNLAKYNLNLRASRRPPVPVSDGGKATFLPFDFVENTSDSATLNNASMNVETDGIEKVFNFTNSSPTKSRKYEPTRQTITALRNRITADPRLDVLGHSGQPRTRVAITELPLLTSSQNNSKLNSFFKTDSESVKKVHKTNEQHRTSPNFKRPRRPTPNRGTNRLPNESALSSVHPQVHKDYEVNPPTHSESGHSLRVSQSTLHFNRTRFLHKPINKYKESNVLNMNFDKLNVFNINGTSFINLNANEEIVSNAGDVRNYSTEPKNPDNNLFFSESKPNGRNLVYLVNYGTINIIPNPASVDVMDPNINLSQNSSEDSDATHDALVARGSKASAVPGKRLNHRMPDPEIFTGAVETGSQALRQLGHFRFNDLGSRNTDVYSAIELHGSDSEESEIRVRSTDSHVFDDLINYSDDSTKSKMITSKIESGETYNDQTNDKNTLGDNSASAEFSHLLPVMIPELKPNESV